MNSEPNCKRILFAQLDLVERDFTESYSTEQQPLQISFVGQEKNRDLHHHNRSTQNYYLDRTLFSIRVILWSDTTCPSTRTFN